MNRNDKELNKFAIHITKKAHGTHDFLRINNKNAENLTQKKGQEFEQAPHKRE